MPIAILRTYSTVFPLQNFSTKRRPLPVYNLRKILRKSWGKVHSVQLNF